MPAEHAPTVAPDRASTRLRVRVVPGARRAGVVGRLGEAWKVRVTSPPERGRANEDVVRLLAERLSVPRSDVRVVAGHASRDKLVEVGHVSAEDAERRLAAAEAAP